MRRITGSNYIIQDGKRKFTDGSPGTTLGSEWLNAVQEELLNVIESVGLNESTDNDQLLKAIQPMDIVHVRYRYDNDLVEALSDNVGVNCVYFVDGAVSLTADCVLPAGSTLWSLANKGVINFLTFNLTMRGMLTVIGNGRIFSKSDTGNVTFEAGSVIEVTPEMFGAVGDGVVDDTAPIQYALDSLEVQAKGTVLLVGQYRISDNPAYNIVGYFDKTYALENLTASIGIPSGVTLKGTSIDVLDTNCQILYYDAGSAIVPKSSWLRTVNSRACGIKSLSIALYGAGAYGKGGTGVHLRGGSNHVVEDLTIRIRGMGNVGFFVDAMGSCLGHDGPGGIGQIYGVKVYNLYVTGKTNAVDALAAGGTVGIWLRGRVDDFTAPYREEVGQISFYSPRSHWCYYNCLLERARMITFYNPWFEEATSEVVRLDNQSQDNYWYGCQLEVSDPVLEPMGIPRVHITADPAVTTGTDNSGIFNKLTSMIDTTKDFVALGVVAGNYLYNTTDGSYGVVSLIDTTFSPNDTVVCLGGFKTGVNNYFNDTDEYRISERIPNSGNIFWLNGPHKMNNAANTIDESSGTNLFMPSSYTMARNSSRVYACRRIGDPAPRHQVREDGQHWWGGGSTYSWMKLRRETSTYMGLINGGLMVEGQLGSMLGTETGGYARGRWDGRIVSEFIYFEPADAGGVYKLAGVTLANNEMLMGAGFLVITPVTPVTITHISLGPSVNGWVNPHSGAAFPINHLGTAVNGAMEESSLTSCLVGSRSSYTGAIATGTVVPHGLGVVPVSVVATPATNAGSVWVDNIDATNFTINFDGGGTHIFRYTATRGMSSFPMHFPAASTSFRVNFLDATGALIACDGLQGQIRISLWKVRFTGPTEI